MKLTKQIIAIVALVITVVTMTGVVVTADSDRTPPTTLQIGIKHKIAPELCTRKSVNGDTLSMHYTGTLCKLYYSLLYNKSLYWSTI